MGDLISRKALANKIEKAKSDSNSFIELVFLDGILAIIDTQPTAYDVNKVVEQLEAKIQPNEDFETGEPCNNWVVDMQNDLVIECIDIVKKGAVKDE